MTFYAHVFCTAFCTPGASLKIKNNLFIIDGHRGIEDFCISQMNIKNKIHVICNLCVLLRQYGRHLGCWRPYLFYLYYHFIDFIYIIVYHCYLYIIFSNRIYNNLNIFYFYFFIDIQVFWNFMVAILDFGGILELQMKFLIQS